MKHNPLYIKRLAAYSLFSSGFLLLQQPADAQISYHDIDPDEKLDDGLEFFTIHIAEDFGSSNLNFTRSASFYSTATPSGSQFYLNHNWAIVTNSSMDLAGSVNTAISVQYPYVYNLGEEIGNDAAFVHPYTAGSGSIYFNGELAHYLKNISGPDTIHFERGHWLDEEIGKFMGFRIIGSDGYHYGWVRMDMIIDGPERDLTIKDYAYDLTPDKSIITGDTGTAIVNIATENILPAHVYSFNKNIYIQTSAAIPDITVHIYNSTGILIYTGNTPDEMKIISMDNSAEGVYLVTLTSQNRSFIKKIILD